MKDNVWMFTFRKNVNPQTIINFELTYNAHGS
jgi:hypothetical protein